MMAEFFQWLMNFFREFKLLAIVLPWERAARIRFGNRVVVWEPGCHFRLPFFDHVQPLNTRLRIADAGSQTLTTLDGHALTVGVNIGFRIDDPLAALLKMQHPENSCAAIAASCVAAVVSATKREALTPRAIEEHVAEALSRETTYAIDFVRIRNYVFARTYRLLNDPGYNQGVMIEERKL